MLQSMTAFAQAQKEIEEGHLCWEIKSVNHRYFDVSFRLPEFLRFLETDLRGLLRDKINRGKLECHLKFNSTNSNNPSILINKGIVNALVDLSNQLAASYHVANDLTVSGILSWPDALEVLKPDGEALSQHVLSLFKETVEHLIQMRTREGYELKLFIEEHLNQLNREVDHAEAIISEESSELKNKLLARLHRIQMEVQEQRIEQEIALILTRMDVGEEIERLKTHAKEVSKTLNSVKVAGRRLDFLMQELNREANTLSSKSGSLELTQIAVEIKVLIEQMREQIQNIE